MPVPSSFRRKPESSGDIPPHGKHYVEGISEGITYKLILERPSLILSQERCRVTPTANPTYGKVIADCHVVQQLLSDSSALKKIYLLLQQAL